MDGATPHDAALREAWEEAGVKGKIVGNCLGIYSYKKYQKDEQDLAVVVAVFAVKVRRLESKFPEADERKRKWMSRKKAAMLVAEPDLKQIILDFDPKTRVH